MKTSIHEVKQAQEAQLMAVPGVVSVRIGRDAEGQICERPERRQHLPKNLEGYAVRTKWSERSRRDKLDAGTPVY